MANEITTGNDFTNNENVEDSFGYCTENNIENNIEDDIDEGALLIKIDHSDDNSNKCTETNSVQQPPMSADTMLNFIESIDKLTPLQQEQLSGIIKQMSAGAKFINVADIPIYVDETKLNSNMARGIPETITFYRKVYRQLIRPMSQLIERIETIKKMCGTYLSVLEVFRLPEDEFIQDMMRNDHRDLFDDFYYDLSDFSSQLTEVADKIAEIQPIIEKINEELYLGYHSDYKYFTADIPSILKNVVDIIRTESTRISAPSIY